MKYKVIDVKSEVEENVQFGTCDLCMSVGTLEKEFIVLEDEKGRIYEIETGEWDWGDYMTMIYIDNIADFSGWLSKRDITREMDTYQLYELVSDYNEYKEK